MKDLPTSLSVRPHARSSILSRWRAAMGRCTRLAIGGIPQAGAVMAAPARRAPLAGLPRRIGLARRGVTAPRKRPAPPGKTDGEQARKPPAAGAMEGTYPAPIPAQPVDPAAP